MKQKILLVAGCSHAAGAEIDGSTDSEYNRKNSFGNILAYKLERTPINIAIHGTANSGIARSVLNWFHKEYDPNTMDVFTLVAWTESSRLEVSSKNHSFGYHLEGGSPNADWFDVTCNEYHRINFGWFGGDAEERKIIPTYHRFMADNATMLETWAANYVLQLQYFFESKQIQYLMCDTMHMFNLEDKFVKQYSDLIDSAKYYCFNKGDGGTFFWKYRNLGYINPKAKYWHHDEVPHQLYAEELYDFIQEKKHV
jgi:hypothetical protein